MSSIFQAANRRMRRGKGQSKSNDSIEIDADSESSYNERNIDHEIEMQRLRDLQPSSSLFTPGMLTRESSSGRFDSLSSSQSMSPSASLQDTKDVGLTPGDAKKPPVPPTYEEHQQMQRQRAGFDAPVTKATLSPIMPVAPPLGGSNPQSPCCAVTHYPAYPGSELTPLITADVIKPTVRRRYSVDELGDGDVVKQQSDAVRSSDAATLQQRKCARERALQRTKEILEQDDNLDDLLSQPRDFSVARNTDTLSVTSDYSTMSSSNTTSEHKAPPCKPAVRRGNVYSIDLAPTSTRDALQSQSCSNLHPAGGSPVWPPSDKYAKHSPHDGVVSQPRSKSGEKRVELAATDDGVPRRHGSLDSLIDRVDGATRPTASGVDGNEDFLESITATLDHKLELIAPSPPSRLQSSDGKAQNCVEGVVYERPFRNPSLHRTLQQGLEGHGDLSFPPSGGEDVSACAYSDAIRKSTEQLYGSRDDLIERKPDGGAPVEMLLKRKARSPSPPAVRRRRDAADRRRIKRRHTVGGSNDLEHFKALMQVCQSNVAEQKPSAWERLQPQRSPPGAGGPPDLKTWLVQQHHLRHVGSSPALFTGAPLLSERGQSPDANRLSSKGWRHRTGFSRSASTGEELSTHSSPVSPPGGCAGSFTFESEVWYRWNRVVSTLNHSRTPMSTVFDVVRWSFVMWSVYVVLRVRSTSCAMNSLSTTVH